MHDLLNRLLQKKKLKTEDLTSDEKADFDRWQGILSADELTVDKIKKFCQVQLGIINTQFKDLANTHEKNQRLIVLHTVYTTLVELINSPHTEKENLEKYLEQLLTG